MILLFELFDLSQTPQINLKLINHSCFVAKFDSNVSKKKKDEVEEMPGMTPFNWWEQSNLSGHSCSSLFFFSQWAAKNDWWDSLVYSDTRGQLCIYAGRPHGKQHKMCHFAILFMPHSRPINSMRCLIGKCSFLGMCGTDSQLSVFMSISTHTAQRFAKTLRLYVSIYFWFRLNGHTFSSLCLVKLLAIVRKCTHTQYWLIAWEWASKRARVSLERKKNQHINVIVVCWYSAIYVAVVLIFAYCSVFPLGLKKQKIRVPIVICLMTMIEPSIKFCLVDVLALYRNSMFNDVIESDNAFCSIAVCYACFNFGNNHCQWGWDFVLMSVALEMNCFNLFYAAALNFELSPEFLADLNHIKNVFP